MKGISFSRFMILFMVMSTMFSTSVYANSYYSKATAKAVGEGKVYVSYKSATESPKYSAESFAESGADKQNSEPIHTYYFYAQASEGDVFVGWYENEECTGSTVSSDEVYSISFTVNSTESETPTTKTLYAKFVDASAPILIYSETRVYANLSSGVYKNETLKATNVQDGGLSYESSNKNVATVADDGTVTFVTGGSCVIKAKACEAETSYILTVIDDVAAGVTQIGNGDFENWSTVTGNNHAPANWNSFETAEGGLASVSSAQQVQMVEDGRPGSNGFFCADIYSRSVLGIIAQGNLTTGCINAGAASATAKGNYNFSKTSDPMKSETLSKVPTAIRFWAKFVPAAENAEHPNAHMEAVIHDSQDYITYSDPSYQSSEEKSHAIAKARKDFPTTNGEWVEFTVPFVMTNNAANGQLHIILNLATNADPGQGQTGDHLYIDDVELLYETEYEEASVVMTADSYTTFCAPFDVNVPYGMTAYAVQGVNDGATLDLIEVEGTIPANTAVILKGYEEASLTAYGEANPVAVQTGLLTGVYEETMAPVGSYVLQNINDVVGFYQVAAGQQPTVKPNQAYLSVLDSDLNAYFFNVDDATGIKNVSVNDIEGTVYNLSGQRICKIRKGINIINGKKLLK